MFNILTEGFREAKLKLKGKTLLTEGNVSDALSSVQRSLLDADVEYSVVKGFIQSVKNSVLGSEVDLRAGTGSNKIKVSPSDHFVSVCHKELVNLMGPVDTELNLPGNRPAIIMMVGLQGSGKTTTAGKLASYLTTTQKKKPLLVAADIYRPAAVEQLRTLGLKINVPVFHVENSDPVKICRESLNKAYELGRDVIILDTAGRLTIDEDLMQELVNIKRATRPDEIFLVCDAMMGQDAVTTAKAFDGQLNLSGTIVTKLDGDARGGAALSIKQVTGKPIKFLGMGEGLDRLEPFRPEGLADRILGMGDVVSLMDDFSRVTDENHEQDMARMLQGQFNYTDFYKQIQTLQKMGSLKDIVAKLPMQEMLPKNANIDDKELVKIKAIIDSMTKKERHGIDRLIPGRVRRIAKGSGRREKEVEDLIKKFAGMKKMMGMFSKNAGGLLGKIPGVNALKQMSNIKNLANNMKSGGLGSSPEMGDFASMFNPHGTAGGGIKPIFDRDKQKKLRKTAKQARKKNRK